jgi:hypothetical protein
MKFAGISILLSGHGAFKRPARNGLPACIYNIKLNLTACALHVKLPCSMKIIYPLLLLFSLALQQSAPVINAPVTGQKLQGKVDVTGTTDVSNFASAELAFTYASDSTENWFAIQSLSQPVLNSVLAIWDTAFISDGDYQLRLRVTLQDGSFQDFVVKDLHIRNYTPDTPTPVVTVAITDTPTALPFSPPTEVIVTEAPTQTPRFTPTKLSPNPVSLTPDEIYSSVKRGAFFIIILFIIFGLLTRLRRP